jgi:serine/threonine-protein kinase
MRACPVCSGELATSARFCPACGAATATAASSPALSHLDTREGTPAPRTERTPSDVFHGRFLPGTVLGARYRIVGLLGKGGMGEVYRADDLKLGQQVALKFLPARFARDPDRLGRLLEEVRVARQISHPNVCRVYDAGEAGGEHFISMEYIHGEDLATLLQRIGRLPPDKSLQIARQLCAGLAAAHDKAMVHRDLKPANVMLDEKGVARITDFGLAGLAEDAARGPAPGGTPAYMAPEQLAGAPASVRTDLYALGLVLYELFTGQPAFQAGSLKELMRVRETTPTPVEPTRLVDNLDPAVERVILRCLETEPRARPASALAVAASLPGGDPLAAALAAGETPAPELVAAASEEIGIQPRTALLCLLGVGLATAAAIWLGTRYSLPTRVAMPHPPEVLAAKARETLESLGHAQAPRDTAYGFRADDDYTQYVNDTDKSVRRWSGPAAARPPVLRFWYRESPRPLEPEFFYGPLAGGSKVSRSDPPMTISGMRSVELDPEGRLLSLMAVPPQVDAAAAPAHPVSWDSLFAAAGLDLARFRAVEPTWAPLADVDTRAAWEGSYEDRPELTLRVEAAGYRGLPVWFEILGPWSRPGRMEEAPRTRGQTAAMWVGIVLLGGIVLGSLWLARRSLRSRRGDRRGAGRLATLFLCASMLTWVIGADHVGTAYEFGMLVMAVSWSLFAACMVWVVYIAAEPFVRRRWPRMLISWTRLLALRMGDPLVGRDVLLGSLAGSLVGLIVRSRSLLGYRLGGLPDPPQGGSLLALGGGRYVAVDLLNNAMSSLFSGLAVLFILLVLRAMLRKDGLANAAFLVVFSAGAILGSDAPLVEAILRLSIWGIVLSTLRTFGLTAVVCGFFVANQIINGPYSLDLPAWHTWPLTLNLLVVAALSGFGFSRALAGRPLFKDSLLEA